jgi:hypothetical protein
MNIDWKDQTVIDEVKKQVKKSKNNLTAAFLRVGAKYNIKPSQLWHQWYTTGLREAVTGLAAIVRQPKTSGVTEVTAPTAETVNLIKETMIKETLLHETTVDGLRIVTVQQIFKAVA